MEDRERTGLRGGSFVAFFDIFFSVMLTDDITDNLHAETMV